MQSFSRPLVKGQSQEACTSRLGGRGKVAGADLSDLFVVLRCSTLVSIHMWDGFVCVWNFRVLFFFLNEDVPFG